jgi:hypothetical protein
MGPDRRDIDTGAAALEGRVGGARIGRRKRGRKRSHKRNQAPFPVPDPSIPSIERSN